MDKIQEILQQLSLEEKIALTTGANNWQTVSFEKYGVPSVVMSDGPHGLRKEQVDENNPNVFNSVKATAFPTASLAACSFDRKLVGQMGKALGEECITQGVDLLLGPGVNIKRSPIGGRNFEYFSEDPLISGELGAAYINGVQSNGIGTSLKHFFANSQEFRRVTGSSDVDERTLREIYLTNFEIAVKKGKPWTVMAAYNKINGCFATENAKYNENVLRDKWGFKGAIISDWGATHDRIKALIGGTDLTMPKEQATAEVVQKIKHSPELQKVLDRNCERLLALALKVKEQRDKRKKESFKRSLKPLEVAQKVAEESLVLLKNKDQILPISKKQKITFIGDFAKNPRYQGFGSSHVNSIHVISALEAVSKITEVSFSQGYQADGQDALQLRSEAAEKAKKSDLAVVFVGLPETYESEGYDRSHMKLPEDHVKLIDAVSKANPNTIVVLQNGSPVEMPWADKVKGIVEMYLGGDAGGQAIVNALFGIVNPSGRLAESFPYKLEDHSSYLFFGGEGDHVEYREGVFVGYRYFETKKMPVRYPFGYGLSYTTFDYTDLVVDQKDDKESAKVTVTITNSGDRTGKEVVQLYVSPHKGNIIRPVKELKGFTKVTLQPKESKQVSFELDHRSFAYWNVEEKDWSVETGDYDIIIGKNAHENILVQTIHIVGDTVKNQKLTELSTIGDLLKNPNGVKYWEKISDRFFEAVTESGFANQKTDTKQVTADELEEQKNNDMYKLLLSLPITTLSQMIPEYSLEKLKQDIAEVNHGSWRLY
ncbi:MAG: glycoside hydrolase family 3 C-terminal domain-containing protein [Liquorilactobacillus nagelii]|uniref:glycoside hydrolase family 3 C-terminal domain-containing protein n=1 Tax=Liquorilactobacillus TaxID=2767888 RepID=UPI0039EC3625